MKKPMQIVEADPAVMEVWSHWLKCVHAGRPGVTPVLSPKRELAIRRALKAYPVEVCKQAIDGIVLSPFHMGKNSRKKRYDDITLILRDPEHVEKFCSLADGQTRADADREAFLTEEAW